MLDVEAKPNIPFIMGQPLVNTAKLLVDIDKGQVKFKIKDSDVCFKVVYIPKILSRADLSLLEKFRMIARLHESNLIENDSSSSMLVTMPILCLAWEIQSLARSVGEAVAALVQENDEETTLTLYFYLTAAPQCFMLDYYLDKAIETGLFDYVCAQFHNNPPCPYYRANFDATFPLKSWNAQTSLVLPNNTVFMGLPTAAPSCGYIPPKDFITKQSDKKKKETSQTT
ncbi:hypothetical protein KIW84_021792 [Lathyrus oleraceus]|uniref:Uncharacterized protein n=1 Tax=Pisum sativum TaxID=3888 RepID=A0A9D4YAT7_PEA|nr:hypothetical protein KIW84_021792 [Pisum sativum]